MADFVCKHCGTITEKDKLIVQDVTFKNGTKHREARCPECNHWIQYLPQGGPVLFYWGKYPITPIEEIHREDPDYLKWALRQSWLKPRLRTAIEAVMGEK